MNQISVVINTKNAQALLEKTLKSVKWADEIIIMDMESQDNTLKIAQKYTDKIYKTKDVGFVEPARNKAINKANHNWILIVDADEEIPPSLKTTLENKTKSTTEIFYLPRKNIIFDKWIKHTGWWPDYQLRFFKKNSVVWPTKVHQKPTEKSSSQKLEATEENAIIHHNYQTIEQFIARLNRYTTIQANSWHKQGKKASIKFLIKESVDEFLRRYFFFSGYKDGTHGLALSLLQAFSQATAVLKLWQAQDFADLEPEQAHQQIIRSIKDIKYWIANQKLDQTSFPLKRLFFKIKRKIYS